jgi:Ca-activated chloride channel homolog
MTRRTLLAAGCVLPLRGPLTRQALAQTPASAPAQDPQAAPIRVLVNEVIVPVTVTDEKGRFVSDLEEKDFKIFEEGRQQKIKYFNRERNQPVVVGFLLDISNATRLHWKVFQEAAIDLVNTLLPGDKKYSGYLITYGNEAELAVNTSSDPERMMEKIRKTKPGGGAALYDAVYMACTSRDLVKGEPIEPRRVIVIIGDGHDSASKKGVDEVVELAHRNLVTIYGVSTVAFGFASDGEKNLARLAGETGGRVEYPLNKLYKDVSGYLSTPSDEGNYAYKVGTGGYASEISKGIFNAIAAVSGEITTQYILRYIPDTTDTSKLTRNITVEVALPGVLIRHRKFYYPVNP